ncbi:hypothetical protein [Fictibacillus sp. S7]|nr:hypothetical protein [Fictibacillus sp. S7]
MVGNLQRKSLGKHRLYYSHARSNIEYDLEWLEKLLIFLRKMATDNG